MLIPGASSTVNVWSPDLLRGLAQGRQLITFDPAGMGLSADTSGNASVEYYAYSTALLLDALGLEQPDVLGW